MNTGIYTNCGEEVPLGVECALLYLDAVAEVILQRADSGGPRDRGGEHAGPGFDSFPLGLARLARFGRQRVFANS